MPSTVTHRTIEEKLSARLAPAHLEVIDESHLHAGHAGARSGGGHYRVTIVAAAFEGLGRLDRHRLIYEILDAEMKGAIHALALKTIAPSERGDSGRA